MSVLVCDDDLVSRRIIKRTIARKSSATVFEASDGLEALELLQTHPFDLLIIDLEMPVMGGIEVIKTIRRSQSLASIRVVVISGHKENDVVIDAVKLKVSDFLVKPIDQDFLASRMARLISAIGERRVTPRRTSGLSANAVALIADGDPDFRQYFKDVVGTRCTLREAGSGAEALRMCLRENPDVLFVGTDLGLLRATEVVTHVRAAKGDQIRVIGIPAKSEAEAARRLGLYDEVLARSYDPARFGRDIARLLRPLVPFELLTQEVPNIRTRVLRAAEQVFGRMLSTDVEPAERPAEITGPRASATVTITRPTFVATLRVRFDLASGRVLAGAFLECDGSDLGDEDVVSVAGELVNVLGGRILAAFNEARLEASIGLPELSTETAGTASTPERSDGPSLDQHFRAVDKPVTFQLDLAVAAAATDEQAPMIDQESGVTMLRADN
jgi:two-component system chemotaxis response regulator CheY